MAKIYMIHPRLKAWFSLNLEIEHYFGVDENWLRLTIEADSVEDLRSSKHGNLKGLEYFGVVRQQAIVSTEKCQRSL
jgi:hypothetical protein